MKVGQPKILVATRGDYITRLSLDPLLRNYPVDRLHVIVVSSDSHGRSGMNLLKAMWRDYGWHYFFFELYQFFAFKLAKLLFPGTPFSVHSLAESLGIPVTVTDKINRPDILDFAQHWKPDILVSVKCTQRIHAPLLSVARLGAINVHGSLLPKYAGRAPHFWAMVHGEHNVGASVHMMSDAFDEGAILVQKSTPLPQASSVFSVITSVARLGGEALMEALPLLSTGAAGDAQDVSQRTYYSSPSKEAYKRLRENGFRLIAPGQIIATIREENSAIHR